MKTILHTAILLFAISCAQSAIADSSQSVTNESDAHKAVVVEKETAATAKQKAGDKKKTDKELRAEEVHKRLQDIFATDPKRKF